MNTVWDILDDGIVATFGRFNPPTKGHMYLIDQICITAEILKYIPRVYISQSEANDANPLPFDYKLELLRGIYGDHLIQFHETNSLVKIFHQMASEKSNCVFMVGEDQVKSIQQLLDRCNGAEFFFNSYKVQSIGKRMDGEDLTDLVNVSGTKLREAVWNNDRTAFEQLLMSGFTLGNQHAIWDFINAYK